MATYVTDEVVFDLPDGFTDRSITVLSSRKPSPPMSMVVSRDTREGVLEKQAAEHVEAIKAASPPTKVIGSRSREVGNLPAREVRMTTVVSRQPLYVRQTWISYYQTLLSVSVTATRDKQSACDAIADRLFDGMLFRKK